MTGELRQLVKSAINVARRDELIRLGRSAQAREAGRIFDSQGG